jgi:hypothetical protein
MFLQAAVVLDSIGEGKLATKLREVEIPNRDAAGFQFLTRRRDDPMAYGRKQYRLSGDWQLFYPDVLQREMGMSPGMEPPDEALIVFPIHVDIQREAVVATPITSVLPDYLLRVDTEPFVVNGDGQTATRAQLAAGTVHANPQKQKTARG